MCDSAYRPLKSAYVDITVLENPVARINEENVTLRVGETHQLTATITNRPSQITGWASSDRNVVEVDVNTGELKAKNPGIATITLWVTVSVRPTCYVTVLPSGLSEDRTQSITPEVDSLILKENETKEIGLTYKDGFEVGVEADFRIDADHGDECSAEIRDLDKSAKTAKLVVTGLKGGNTNIRLHLMDPIRNSVFDMALPVLVESEESEPEEPEDIDEVLEGDVPSGGVPDGYWAAVDTNFMYTGNPIEATLRVYKNRRLLTKGNDYTVSYTNNTNVGNASVTITGIGQHSFSIRDSFKIIGKSIEDGVAALDSEWYMYNGNPVIPTVTVYYGGSQLQKDKDYTVRLENNSGAGKGKVYITGKGLYQGEIIKEFDIYQEIGDTTESITLPSAISMNVGEKKTITATTSPSGLAVDWYIDEEDIAVIDQNTGEITAQKAGKATIIAMSKEAYATCELTVTGSQQPAAGGDVEFNLGNVTGDVFPGGTVKIPVNIGANDGFCSLGIQFSYDSSIFDFQSIQIDPEISSKISLKDDYQKAPGVINAAYVCNKNITGKNTTFGHLVLTVKENAVVGKNFTVSIIYRDVLNENDERLNVTGTRTSVTGRIVEVPRVIPGDLNGDKKPGLQDARMVLQYVTKVVGFTLNEKQLEAADVNRDGRVNLVDALWILEYYTEKRASF